VLVVDDDKDTREALADALVSAGMLVDQTSDGGEALERIMTGEAPDVILLDMHMPGIDGAQLLERLRKMPGGYKARVILLTGDTPARVLRFAAEAKLLRKPIDLDELEVAVKDACAA
jgi:two-component system response regulator (stage 0 sporulation protein F)